MHDEHLSADIKDEHLKRKREEEEDNKEESELTNVNNSLLAQLHRERNQRRPPIEKASLSAQNNNVFGEKEAMMNA